MPRISIVTSLYRSEPYIQELYDRTCATLKDITDGSSNTIAMIEAAGQINSWMEPVDLEIDRTPLVINGGIPSASSHHPGGVNAAMADGSIRFISNTIAPPALKGLTTRGGGEAVVR